MIRSISLGGVDIELEMSDEAFQPTLITKMLAKLVSIPPEADVLDLGCGVGPLAILAAKKGAKTVVASDIMPEACRLAQRNAERNGVGDKVSVVCGSLFDAVGDARFDIIINDVSGVADEVARLSPWYPPSIPTGGGDGADVIVPMLNKAPNYMKPGGTIWFPTGTISNVPRTLAAAQEAFGNNVQLVSEMDVPFCEEFLQDLDTMRRLKSQGIIDYVNKRSRYLWQLQFYKAQLQASAS